MQRKDTDSYGDSFICETIFFYKNSLALEYFLPPPTQVTWCCWNASIFTLLRVNGETGRFYFYRNRFDFSQLTWVNMLQIEWEIEGISGKKENTGESSNWSVLMSVSKFWTKFHYTRVEMKDKNSITWTNKKSKIQRHRRDIVFHMSSLYSTLSRIHVFTSRASPEKSSGSWGLYSMPFHPTRE